VFVPLFRQGERSVSREVRLHRFSYQPANYNVGFLPKAEVRICRLSTAARSRHFSGSDRDPGGPRPAAPFGLASGETRGSGERPLGREVERGHRPFGEGLPNPLKLSLDPNSSSLAAPRYSRLH